MTQRYFWPSKPSVMATHQAYQTGVRFIEPRCGEDDDMDLTFQSFSRMSWVWGLKSSLRPASNSACTFTLFASSCSKPGWNRLASWATMASGVRIWSQSALGGLATLTFPRKPPMSAGKYEMRGFPIQDSHTISKEQFWPKIALYEDKERCSWEKWLGEEAVMYRWVRRPTLAQIDVECGKVLFGLAEGRRCVPGRRIVLKSLICLAVTAKLV